MIEKKSETNTLFRTSAKKNIVPHMCSIHTELHKTHLNIPKCLYLISAYTYITDQTLKKYYRQSTQNRLLYNKTDFKILRKKEYFKNVSCSDIKIMFKFPGNSLTCVAKISIKNLKKSFDFIYLI